MSRALSFTAALLGIATIPSGLCSAQDGDVSTGAPRNREPVVFTTRQDHQNMLDQLGITKLRPGRDSNPNSPNPANYDQAKANPYPKLPEILETRDGTKITTPERWWNERRPEIVELLEREVYGRIPESVPKVRWEVRETREVEAGGKPAIQRHIVGVVDSSACPRIEVNISMSLTLPKETDGSVPVLMSFGWTPFEPSPFGPRVVMRTLPPANVLFADPELSKTYRSSISSALVPWAHMPKLSTPVLPKLPVVLAISETPFSCTVTAPEAPAISSLISM